MKQSVNKYLEKYHAGKIEKGLGIDLVQLDDYLRYKQGQFNIINGLDNVGKTVWLLWYFLCLAVKHDKTFCIWSGENSDGMLTRQLIEMYVGKKLKDIPLDQVYHFQQHLSNYFKFIPNDKMYTNKDLYKLFIESEADCCLIDPYTGMKREYTHAANYDFLNETREFCNKYKTTVYVNTHPNTEAARRTYASGDEAGYPMPPSRSQSEGGQPFANRVDDFITIHRLVGHPVYGYNTHIYVRKVKDTETGGKVSPIDDPISFSYNNGLGFTCGGINPLTGEKIVEQQPELTPIDKLVTDQYQDQNPF